MANIQTIRQLMKAANITQQQLADRLGVKQSTVSEMLNPKSNPRLSTLRKLARELSVSIEMIAATYEDRDTSGIPDDLGGEENN
jgi:transcriptional regulator with XRE-family HTH domain